MRQTIAVAATASVFSAVLAVWGTTVIIAQSGKEPRAAAGTMSVMQMMTEAKNLPVESYEAY